MKIKEGAKVRVLESGEVGVVEYIYESSRETEYTVRLTTDFSCDCENYLPATDFEVISEEEFQKGISPLVAKRAPIIEKLSAEAKKLCILLEEYSSEIEEYGIGDYEIGCDEIVSYAEHFGWIASQC